MSIPLSPCALNRNCCATKHSWSIVISDYKPELARLAEERKAKAEADKKAQLDRLMRDMEVSDSGPSRTSRNPFGPHPRSDRDDE